MTKSEYLRKTASLMDSGKISEEVYDAMLMNADEFCEDEDDGFLPSYYAEIDYGDRIECDPEAIEGAKFDDMNYLHYRER